MERLVRTKIYICGPEHIETESFFAPSSVRRVRGERTGVKTDASKMERNKRESLKLLRRLLKTNFYTGFDYYVVLTFNRENLPVDIDDTYTVCQRYFENLSDRCSRKGIIVKWLFVVEFGSRGRIHIHAFINACVPIGEIRRGWRYGMVLIKNVPNDAEEIELIASYTLKAPQGRHAWHRSRNLDMPTEETDDKLITPSLFVAMADGGFAIGDVESVMQRIFSGYVVVPGWSGYYSETMQSPYLAVSLQRRNWKKRSQFDYNNPYDISPELLRRVDCDQRELFMGETA